ncbi:MAG: S8 family serine peptidase [Rubrivivax sp.]
MERITALGLPGTQVRAVVAVIDSGVVLNHPTSRRSARQRPQLRQRQRRRRRRRRQRRRPFHCRAAAALPRHARGRHRARPRMTATAGRHRADGADPAAARVRAGALARTSDILQALRYAPRAFPTGSSFVPARRVDVVNMSLGSQGACDSAWATAIADARAAGTAVVVAAGNDANNNAGQAMPVSSPANCAGAIAVSATDARRNIADYSNTGSAIRVAAPGGDLSASTTGSGAADGVYSAVATFDAAGTRQPSFGGKQGTSMAAPHVAGVIALMRYVNPALTVTQIDNLFAVGSLTDDIGAAGRDNTFGFGLVNARKAVDAALAAQGTPPPAPAVQIVALPSSIDFGSLQTQAVIELSAPGTTSESVAGSPQLVLAAGMGAGSLAIAPTAVGTGGLGRYTVTVNRSAIPTPGGYFPSVRFTLSSGRTLTVQLAITQPAASVARGNWGPVYVLLIDPATGHVEHTVLATAANGRYTWSKSGYAKSRVQIVAGGDTDNDDLICARGETCGAFPVLPAGDNFTVVELTGNRSDLNFQVAPLSGMSPAEGGGGRGGLRRSK